MRNYSSIKWALALLLFVLLIASANPAAAASYKVTGKVVDINGNGVPGAKVVLQDNGLQVGDTATTVSSGPDIGTYTIELGMLPWGTYQVFAEKEGKTSSVILKVTGSYTTYTVSNIALRNYAVSGVPATATPVITPSPTAAPSATPEASAAPANATATAVPTPTESTTATPSATPTPMPTPGFLLIGALIAVGLVVAFKRYK